MKVYTITYWPPNAPPDHPGTTIGPFTDRAEAERTASTLAARSDIGRVEIDSPTARPTITIHVDAAMAARACSGRCGPVPIRLSSADLASLTPEQRDTAERHLAGEAGPYPHGPQWGDPIAFHAAPVGMADLATLRSLLDTRRSIMLALLERATAEGCKIFYVETSGQPFRPDLRGLHDACDARESFAKYRALVKVRGHVIVWRSDGACVAKPDYLQHYRENAKEPTTVDVRASKAWHRAAVAVLPSTTARIGGAS